ncbi:MAG: right-handed parallel beta-helix repeat-containing protein [Sedimentisphaerales bacterium]|nr:right-handed parallel beta-helix repeat-containing protein [Sedimentisphaerales bacterium]
MRRGWVTFQIVLCGFYLISFFCTSVFADPFTGTLTENTTWSGDCVVEGSLEVPFGILLTIEPGTNIFMKSQASLLVRGQLMANGTPDLPIRFTHETAGIRWKQILFIEADYSRFSHCIIEYADGQGDHKDYYDDDCDPDTPFPARTYHEVITALACHIDLDGCTFQNMGSNNEGDAIAIISDDPQHPGPAQAFINNCQFLSIGQGIHTRFSHVIVENCYFTGHHGDNDDVDLYGESIPPPLIRNNVFLNPAHDDMINPTRCSAIIEGNLIAGSDDHGVVLRDKCSPVMINNIIYNCSSAGIAVQNQCDAILDNNTIFNCGRGIRFFDHTGRWGPPYCLYPGSGKATITNCIIWDCPTPLELANSPYTEDQGSHATVSYCNIEGGQAASSVSSNSTLTWGQGNIEQDPLFADSDNGDFHLKSQYGRYDPLLQQWVFDGTTSRCIDAGSPDKLDWAKELWPNGRRINMGAYGGTPQAGMSWNTSGNIANTNNDYHVDILDLYQMAEKWLQASPLLSCDLDRNGKVDSNDFAILANQWLWQQEKL